MNTPKTLAIVAAFALTLGVIAAPSAAFATATGTVTVQLVKPSGAKLAVAGIDETMLYRHNGTVLWAHFAVSDGTGKATFPGAPAGVHLNLSTSSNSTYLSASKGGIVAKAGKSVSVKLSVAVGATIGGILTKTGGLPVPGATVALFNSHGNRVGLGTTSATGAYQIAPIRSGKYKVQFNSRAVTSLSPAATSMSWSYWKNSTSWTTATYVTVKQQTAHASASHPASINGFVSGQFVLTVDVNLTGNHGSADVLFVSQRKAENFVTKVDAAGTSFQSYLNAGKYRIAIIGAYDPIVGASPVYWYRGDLTGPTLSESKATWVSFGAANKTIYFEDQPPTF
jgi:hypothetical protein